MTAMHSPGPWLVGREGFTLAVYDQRDLVVAEIAQASGEPSEEEYRDVALIAAAPELLEMLKSILDGGISDPFEVRKAYKAIAKAEGKIGSLSLLTF